MIAAWPCPGPDGPSEEYAVSFDRGRPRRLLIVPALFDEANRTRRFLIETMRLLDRAGIDSILPDLPGCNESLRPFGGESLESWQAAMAAAIRHFACNEVLSLRAGSLIAPAVPGWQLEPLAGRSQLRQLLRARTIAAREEGRSETIEGLLELGRREGLDLAGYACSAALLGGLEHGEPVQGQRPIRQADLGGGALWLRSEPGEAPDQSSALAAILAAGLAP